MTMITRFSMALLLASVLLAQVSDDASRFIARFGKPDVDQSSEREQPRPPIVTRLLTYKKAKIRFAFVLGDGHQWKALGAIDLRTNKPVTLAVAEKRIKAASSGSSSSR